MSRPLCKRFPDYARWIRSLTASQYRAIILDIVDLRFRPTGHRAGHVLFPQELTHVKLTTSPTGIVFRDGSFLVGYEAVEIDAQGEVTPLVYKYHYLRPMDGYYFRYDKPIDPGKRTGVSPARPVGRSAALSDPCC